MTKSKCLICGMTINNKNYQLNASTFTDENTDQLILRCPFCGAMETHLGSQDEQVYAVEGHSYKVQKILDMAMKLEVFNSEFYEEASKQAKSKDLHVLFQELSKIEWMHASVHKILGGFDALPSLRLPDYSRHHTDALLLAEAHKREIHAIAFYKRYYDQVPEVIQKIFRGLMEVETEHVKITEIQAKGD